MILSNAAITAYAVVGAATGKGTALYTAAALPGGVPVMVVVDTPGSKTVARLQAMGVSADREITVRTAVFDRMSIVPKPMDRLTLQDLAKNPGPDVTVEIVDVDRAELPAGRAGRGRCAVFNLACKRAKSLGVA